MAREQTASSFDIDYGPHQVLKFSNYRLHCFLLFMIDHTCCKKKVEFFDWIVVL